MPMCHPSLAPGRNCSRLEIAWLSYKRLIGDGASSSSPKSGRTHYIWVSYKGSQVFASSGEFSGIRRHWTGKNTGGGEFADGQPPILSPGVTPWAPPLHERFTPVSLIILRA